MLHALKKYESMKSTIDRCNDMVIDVLESCTLREAKIASESFNNGGKRLRPALMILSSTASHGGDGDVPTPLIELAAAVELIHLATLFHDDVIDEVETRRMKLSARAKYGNYVSVLAGDYVLAEALLLVHRSGAQHTMPEFLRTIRVLVSGESRETTHKFDLDITEAAYYEIISEKSASLFSLSCKVGGMWNHSPHTDSLGRFGWNLGMAFQMIDDLDDMIDLAGETTDCDLQNGYLALPVIHVLANLEDGHRKDLVDLIRRGNLTSENEQWIAGLCTSEGGVQHAKTSIDAHLERAAVTLERFDDGTARRMLETIIADLRAYAAQQVDGYVGLADASRPTPNVRRTRSAGI